MRYYENILETIGKTPLIKLNAMAKGTKATLLVKAEFFNPGGSIKDRIGKEMLKSAEKSGKLRKGGKIIEPTSGNTGVGLALVAAIKGYKTIFVMPEKMSREKELLLRAYGAEVIRTPTEVAPDDPRSNLKVSERLYREELEKTGNAYMPNQYQNKGNPDAHYKTTGPEIWKDTDGRITHLVVGIGTGGTMTGTARYLKKKNPKVKIIGVDADGSLYHHLFYNTKGKIHSYKVEGIGEDFVPGTIDLKLLDEIVVVSDKESFLTARELARKEGILAGGSSGAAVCGALKLVKKFRPKDVVVIILPDSGKNYLSKCFDDEWMRQNNYL